MFLIRDKYNIGDDVVLLEDELVEIKWERRNKPIFVNKGYNFTFIGDTFCVKQGELSPASRAIVKIQCDYCGGTYEDSMLKYMRRINRKPILLKAACENCNRLRIEELNIMRYGVKTNLMLDSTKEKIRKTNLEKYGVENPAQNEQVQNKMKATMLERYGVEYGAQNDKIREKQINTTIEKYGVKYSLLNKEVKEKAMNTLFSNNSAPTSRTQKYLHELLGGELNYPEGNYYIDILLDGKIAFEYDGGGHCLQVNFGNLSENEFVKKERSREYYLTRRGYKIIRLISNRDRLPNKNILLSVINDCFKYISEGGTITKINIDEGYIRFGRNVINYNFGKLTRMDKEYFDKSCTNTH